MKTCSKCNKELPLSNFSKKYTRFQGFCKSCHSNYRRQHYLKNREKYIKKAKNRTRNFRDWWKLYKSQFKCSCGEDHPACIHFHHPNDDKELGVSQLVTNGNKEKLMLEIAKCVPLCANCHAKIHWNDN
jgi:hypothetical protein